MNVYKRPMFNMQFRANGGPMGEMPMAPPPMDPAMMAPPPMDPAMMAPPVPDPSQELMATEQMADAGGEGIGALFADQVATALESAEEPKEVIDAIRGNDMPLESRYQELADYVGEEDALATPPSVLTMVQPTIMMTEEGAVNSGIGDLMQNITEGVEMETAEGVATPMAEGVGSLMMGVEQPLTQNFRQGGPVVQRFNNGGEGISNLDFLKVPTVKELYPTYLPMYQEALGTGQSPEQAKSQILFDIAQRGLALAGGVSPEGTPLTGSPAQKLAQLTASLPQTVQQVAAQAREGERAAKVAALQAATTERDRLQEAYLKERQAGVEGAIRLAETKISLDYDREKGQTTYEREQELLRQQEAFEKAKIILKQEGTIDSQAQLAAINEKQIKLKASLEEASQARLFDEQRKQLGMRQSHERDMFVDKGELQKELQKDDQIFRREQGELDRKIQTDKLEFDKEQASITNERNKLNDEYNKASGDRKLEIDEALLRLQEESSQVENAYKKQQTESLQKETDLLLLQEENRKQILEQLNLSGSVVGDEGEGAVKYSGNLKAEDIDSVFGSGPFLLRRASNAVALVTQVGLADATIHAQEAVDALGKRLLERTLNLGDTSIRLKAIYEDIKSGIPQGDTFFEDKTTAAARAKQTAGRIQQYLNGITAELKGLRMSFALSLNDGESPSSKDLTRMQKLKEAFKENKIAQAEYVRMAAVLEGRYDPGKDQLKDALDDFSLPPFEEQQYKRDSFDMIEDVINSGS